MTFQHKPVLLREVLAYLEPLPGMVMLDCTLGGGGHSKAILEKILPGGKLIALDQDLEALEAAQQVLHPLGEDNYIISHANFKDLKKVLKQTPYRQVEGILFDLGVSSYQLDRGERGFSYQQDAFLDMRMDRTASKKAYDLVNECTEEELTRIIWNYGEERWAKRIASFIVHAREQELIRTTGQLVQIIKKAIPGDARRQGPHPAKRTFQALRIAVNHELEILAPALKAGLEILKPGGRMAVLTFHSLEDRLAKRVFKDAAQGCICSKDLPICICKHKPKIKILTRKPVIPSEQEIAENPRARSAKLRVVERID
ncbi:MAG TPA: 16S rRNA (cytosine(1402)-N(4))-methyltransferase RsmH [Clostridia bacterium]|jgi:16S rRNA (cytosine1402-N4)-methyltransferase|nr:16S rRNA (cytosine(1402)-N(4))-methyltransferase RsmH [Clostridia bacterium]HHY05528.1 16S rRNA (cytosine(1402)-N(4))-methyltransferase RsmH [Clostridia bacterium]